MSGTSVDQSVPDESVEGGGASGCFEWRDMCAAAVSGGSMGPERSVGGGLGEFTGPKSREGEEEREWLSELDIEYLVCGHPYGHPGVIEGRDEVRRNFEFLQTHVLF